MLNKQLTKETKVGINDWKVVLYVVISLKVMIIIIVGQ